MTDILEHKPFWTVITDGITKSSSGACLADGYMNTMIRLDKSNLCPYSLGNSSLGLFLSDVIVTTIIVTSHPWKLRSWWICWGPHRLGLYLLNGAQSYWFLRRPKRSNRIVCGISRFRNLFWTSLLVRAEIVSRVPLRLVVLNFFTFVRCTTSGKQLGLCKLFLMFSKHLCRIGFSLSMNECSFVQVLEQLSGQTPVFSKGER